MPTGIDNIKEGLDIFDEFNDAKKSLGDLTKRHFGILF